MGWGDSDSLRRFHVVSVVAGVVYISLVYLFKEGGSGVSKPFSRVKNSIVNVIT